MCFNKYIKKETSSLWPKFSFFEYKLKRIDFFKTQLKLSTINEGGKVINEPEYIFEFPCSANIILSDLLNLLTCWIRTHWNISFRCFFLHIQFTRLHLYSHQVHIYLKVSGISVKKPLQNIKIVEKQLDVWILGWFVKAFWLGAICLIQ